MTLARRLDEHRRDARLTESPRLTHETEEDIVKKPSVISVLLLLVATLGLATASEQDEAAQVLNHFFEASGGLEKVRGTQSISATASFEAYAYQYTMHLLADGRFRVEAPDRTTVFDGEKYWQSFHGVVQELTGSDIDRYRDLGLREDIFHGFIDAAGNPARIEYGGQETKRGQVYDLLSRMTAEGNRRTYYVNAATGLVDRMVELAYVESLSHEAVRQVLKKRS